MATPTNYIFEQLDAATAASFGADDSLYFTETLPANLTVTFKEGAGLLKDAITLDDGNGHSFDFAADALTTTNLHFIQTGAGDLVIGTTESNADTNGEDTLTASKDGSAVYALDGNDIINVSKSGLADGGAGDDSITATGTTVVEGDDTSSSSSYTLFGGLGADTITAAGGYNHIYGYAASGPDGATDGADTITVSNGLNYIQGNGGDDVIVVGATKADGTGVDTEVFANRVQGGAGKDTIDVWSLGANSVNGNKGDDTITGHNGDSLLRGGQGDDKITAGVGHDTLMGDAGKDTLIAGGHEYVDKNDTGAASVLTGGDGDDTFDVTTAGAGFFHNVKADGTEGTAVAEAGVTITDFQAGDLIDIGAGADVEDSSIDYGAGATFTDLDAAYNYAANLLGTSATIDIAAINVGSDTYVFYDEAASIVKLAGVADAHSIIGDSFVGA